MILTCTKYVACVRHAALGRRVVADPADPCGEVTGEHLACVVAAAGEARADVSALTAHKSILASTLEARRTSRALTRRMPDTERKRLYQEHAELVNRMFTSELSSDESKRLRYVRWKLDRIEDAQTGDTLDELQMIAEDRAHLARQLKSFIEQAKSAGAEYKARKGR